MNFVGKLALFSVLVVVLSGSLPGICEETGRPASVRSQSQDMEGRNEPDKNVGALFVSVYRDYISRVDSDRCPSIPSCSSYSVRAFKKHGYFMGWLMTVDRLIHEGDEGDTSPLVKGNGTLSILDPVKNNDFWWYSKDGQDQD